MLCVHTRGIFPYAELNKQSQIGARIMVRRIFTFALIAGSLGLTGCNTVQGFGKDLGSAGAALEKVD